jgi:glycosyltransferase involved in cell wall biosynthesis
LEPTSTVAVIIPTLNRPEYLRQCLQAIAAQTLQPTSILVGIRGDDTSSAAVVEEFSNVLPLRRVETQGVGVIGAMSSCLSQTTEDIVALLDDDAFPRRDWLRRITTAFQEKGGVLGVGGLDVQRNPEQAATKRGELSVGRLAWYGRLGGNHHLGSGSPRFVQVLKGCNCAYRGDFLRKIGFDPHLRGQGAQVGWEIALGLDVARERGLLLYDPAIVVDHMIAPRMDQDTIHRGSYNRDAAFEMAWNFFSIVQRKASGGSRVRMLLWEILVGSVPAPGLLRLADSRIGTLGERCRRIATTLRAFREATQHAARVSRRKRCPSSLVQTVAILSL